MTVPLSMRGSYRNWCSTSVSAVMMMLIGGGKLSASIANIINFQFHGVVHSIAKSMAENKSLPFFTR